MIIEVQETGPLNVNTYILKDEKSKEAAVIDIGGGFKKIKQKLDDENFKIKFVLNTHGHYDHVLGDNYVQKNYPQIPIYMHKDDLPHIKILQQEIKDFTLEVNFIDENSELFLGENKIQIFHTPGHTKGGLCFYTAGNLFSGDTLFYRSIGRTDFFDGDYETLINAIKTKLLPLPDNTIVYPGHGIKTSIKAEKKYNELLQQD